MQGRADGESSPQLMKPMLSAMPQCAVTQEFRGQKWTEVDLEDADDVYEMFQYCAKGKT